MSCRSIILKGEVLRFRVRTNSCSAIGGPVMPLGKYHCDYCDKQFQDTPTARKRHLQSSQHRHARDLWYRSFRDPTGAAPLLRPDGTLAPGVCQFYIRTGTCKFGEGCKYFHPKRDAANALVAVPGFNYVDATHLKDDSSNQQTRGTALSGNTVFGVSWGNLPPSLRPPPEGSYPAMPAVDWG